MGHAVVDRETVDRVRGLCSITQLVGETVKLYPAGRSLVGLCPFHGQKRPSLFVSPERGYFHCTGCRRSGDAIAFVMENEGLAFDAAVRHLAGRVGVEVASNADEQAAERWERELYEVNATAATFFERMLREHALCSIGQAELERRGLVPRTPTDSIADTLQAFRVGYAPHSWDALVRHLRDTGRSLPAAESVGLVAPRPSGSGHYDRFRHRLMFAVIDGAGRVVAFSGRALPEPTAAERQKAGLDPRDPDHSGETPAKYINSPESPVYRKGETVFGLFQARQSLRESAEAILVEGNFDVVSLHARGIKSAVAPLGTAFTEQQARLIRRSAPTVVLMFDADSAGRRAAAAARTTCAQAGLSAKVATLPAGLDPDSLIREQGRDAVIACVHRSRPLVEYLVDAILEGGTLADSVEAKAAKVREVAQLLSSEADLTTPARRKQLADRVAERLGISDPRPFDELVAAMQRAMQAGSQAAGSGGDSASGSEGISRTQRRTRQVEQEILGSLLDYPDLVDSSLGAEACELVGPDVLQAIDALRQSRGIENALDLEHLPAKLPLPIHAFAAARLAAPRYECIDEARSKLLDNIGKLKRFQLRCSTSEVEELQRAAASGDFNQEIALLREHERRARKRHGL